MKGRKSALFPDVDFLLPLRPGTVLREAGFKRTGRNFTRACDNAVHGVYFRTSKFVASTFQVVASVFHTGYHEVLSGRSFPANPLPGKAIALVQRDVPCLMEDGSQSPWWQIVYGAEIGPLSESLATALEAKLPFFDSWTDPEVVKARLLGYDAIPEEVQIGTAALAWLLALSGDLDGALAALRVAGLPTPLMAGVDQRLREVAR